MEDLIAFWRARLAELERAAKSASRDKAHGDEWHAGAGGDGWTQAGTGVYRPDGNAVAVAIGGYAADHIAGNDPATVLADIEADRTLLNMYEGQAGRYLPEGGHDGRDPNEREWDAALKATLEDVARIRVAKFASHPDYDEAWRP